jgi:uncharacterized membrane protein YeaQ/YmgE (transglycosylase-associated protein family)
MKGVKIMKNTLKAMKPYIIFNTIIFAIIGAIIGKNLVEIYNTKKKIENDSRALKRFIKDMGGSATHINIEDIDESDVPEDIRKKAYAKDNPVYDYD